MMNHPSKAPVTERQVTERQVTKHQAFTLIELLVVVAIIAILAA
ncbi:MAG: prepilin-type N-terminal cleavage/methylation domain-containing protein, partial [Armatimonadetes bacterium]|nr:prepilin-type N-terminal cleavage/methylation domain-containing protein [Armatimonadota bacterium]